MSDKRQRIEQPMKEAALKTAIGVLVRLFVDATDAMVCFSEVSSDHIDTAIITAVHAHLSHTRTEQSVRDYLSPKLEHAISIKSPRFAEIFPIRRIKLDGSMKSAGTGVTYSISKDDFRAAVGHVIDDVLLADKTTTEEFNAVTVTLDTDTAHDLSQKAERLSVQSSDHYYHDTRMMVVNLGDADGQ